MKKYSWFKFFLLIASTLILVSCKGHPSLLFPKGMVAFEERQIIFDTAALMLIVVIPVIVMSFVFVIHYRKGNASEEYIPNWHHSVFLETLWWGIPIAIITLLAIITWYTTHQLDPYRKLPYPGKTLNVKVIALPWKWLFIYDDENITTVNHLVIPKDRQIAISLTTDNVPMSALFIPQLGSQIYAMAGMQTKLHLIASELGHIEGFNAQYNGVGFDNMRFEVDILTPEAYKKWYENVRQTGKPFTKETYLSVRKMDPNRYPPRVYSGKLPHLFQNVMHGYMLENHPNGERIQS